MKKSMIFRVREKALVELERHQQVKIAAQKTKHNEEIRSLYDEVAELRKVNEQNSREASMPKLKH